MFVSATSVVLMPVHFSINLLTRPLLQTRELCQLTEGCTNVGKAGPSAGGVCVPRGLTISFRENVCGHSAVEIANQVQKSVILCGLGGDLSIGRSFCRIARALLDAGLCGVARSGNEAVDASTFRKAMRKEAVGFPSFQQVLFRSLGSHLRRWVAIVLTEESGRCLLIVTVYRSWGPVRRDLVIGEDLSFKSGCGCIVEKGHVWGRCCPCGRGLVVLGISSLCQWFQFCNPLITSRNWNLWFTAGEGRAAATVTAAQVCPAP